MEERIKQIMDEVFLLQEHIKVSQQRMAALVEEMQAIAAEPEKPPVEPEFITYFDTFAGYNVTNYNCPDCKNKIVYQAKKCPKCGRWLKWEIR